MLGLLLNVAAWFRQARRAAVPVDRVIEQPSPAGGDAVITPKPAFTFFPKRHWQGKYDDILVDLRVLEAAYNVHQEELTRARAAEFARVAEGFFKTCRELADWIYEETGVNAKGTLANYP
jgi:hypothetical protein